MMGKCNQSKQNAENGTSFNEKVTARSDSHDSKIIKVTDGDADLIGKWCVVHYDRKPYPGTILDVDHESVEVKTMHSVGKNRYFWPLCEDVIWYKFESVISFKNEPKNVTKLHVEIEHELWEEIGNYWISIDCQLSVMNRLI
jgi:hypothetical protein